jgi:hypothetical protein
MPCGCQCKNEGIIVTRYEHGIAERDRKGYPESVLKKDQNGSPTYSLSEHAWYTVLCSTSGRDLCSSMLLPRAANEKAGTIGSGYRASQQVFFAEDLRNENPRLGLSFGSSLMALQDYYMATTHAY